MGWEGELNEMWWDGKVNSIRWWLWWCILSIFRRNIHLNKLNFHEKFLWLDYLRICKIFFYPYFLFFIFIITYEYDPYSFSFLSLILSTPKILFDVYWIQVGGNENIHEQMLLKIFYVHIFTLSDGANISFLLFKIHSFFWAQFTHEYAAIQYNANSSNFI